MRIRHRDTKKRPAGPYAAAPTVWKNRGDPVTSERYYDDDETEFLAAIAAYQDRTGDRFPPWSRVLAVLKSLGYIKPCPSNHSSPS